MSERGPMVGAGNEVASSPARFFPMIEREGEEKKNGLAFIARVVVRTRISITQILGNRILQ